MQKSSLTKKEKTLLAEVKVAKTFRDRLVGLMFKKNICDRDVIVFPNCNSIHTFFMRANIDVIFVGTNGLVIKIFHSLRPWRLLWPQPLARHCIEMADQRASSLGISEGDLLVCEGVF